MAHTYGSLPAPQALERLFSLLVRVHEVRKTWLFPLIASAAFPLFFSTPNARLQVCEDV